MHALRWSRPRKLQFVWTCTISQGHTAWCHWSIIANKFFRLGTRSLPYFVVGTSTKLVHASLVNLHRVGHSRSRFCLAFRLEFTVRIDAIAQFTCQRIACVGFLWHHEFHSTFQIVGAISCHHGRDDGRCLFLCSWCRDEESAEFLVVRELLQQRCFTRCSIHSIERRLVDTRM